MKPPFKSINVHYGAEFDEITILGGLPLDNPQDTF